MNTHTTTGISRRSGVLAVHSVDAFVFTVPDITVARQFYTAFGLEVRQEGPRLDLYTFGNAHCWASIYESGASKQLQYVRFGIFAEDELAFRQRIAEQGATIEPHALGDKRGIWFRNPDGTTIQLVVAPKVSPSIKTAPTSLPAAQDGLGAAPARSQVSAVQPSHLSHILLFSPDVSRMVAFCCDVLGLRLSDRSGDVIAFLHSPHGSDHHLVAFAKSHAAGLHHSSWAVGSIDEIGYGSEHMREAGWDKGWGLGRHVLGSNYFYYVQDPWGSFCEYSFDIDFVPVSVDWSAGDHALADSLYVWGPAVPENFITNCELVQT